MNILRRLTFNLWYLRRPPWDSRIVPPEIQEFIRTHKPGRALDLGCGTGTSSLALARAGWQVSGVDFASRAIRTAKRRARSAGLHIGFMVGDVTHLPPYPSAFDLVLDIGCFHSLDRSGKLAYLDQLDRLLSSGGTWLMYGFIRPDSLPGPGMSRDEIALAEAQFKSIERQNGTDRGERQSAWFWFEKK
jgi:ubiquinone/menaquinone biosynthesis C-methylase UbiE